MKGFEGCEENISNVAIYVQIKNIRVRYTHKVCIAIHRVGIYT